MFRQSYKVATVWGIPIKVHVSHMAIILIICMELAPYYFKGLPFPMTLITGLILSILFAISLVLHELGHSFVAIKKGCRVRSIVIGIWGGVATMENIPSKPKDELLMALAGPLVSLLLSAVSFGLAFSLLLSQNPLLLYLFGIFFIIGSINLVLALFNIVPAFPMDGGRVLRAALTGKKGRVKATYIASRVGRVFAAGFGLWGLYDFFSAGEPWALTRVIIAVLIYSMAEKEYQMVRMQEAAQWFDLGDTPDDHLDDMDRAEISPPPYEEGPGTRSRVENMDDNNPFTNSSGSRH